MAFRFRRGSMDPTTGTRPVTDTASTTVTGTGTNDPSYNTTNGLEFDWWYKARVGKFPDPNLTRADSHDGMNAADQQEVADWYNTERYNPGSEGGKRRNAQRGSI